MPAEELVHQILELHIIPADMTFRVVLAWQVEESHYLDWLSINIIYVPKGAVPLCILVQEIIEERSPSLYSFKLLL
jgi:hypothetical protein